MKKYKICFSIIIMIFIMLYTSSIFAATSIDLNLSSTSNNIKNGDEVSILVSLDDFKDVGEGINAYVATFKFNVNEFDIEKFEGQNDWNNPTYNNKTISDGYVKLAATRSDFTKSEDSILKIVLKAKKDISEDVEVSLGDFSVAAKINNKTTKVTVESKKIVLSKSGEKEGAGDINNDEEEEDKTISDKEIPPAGIVYSVIGISTIFITILLIVFYFKYKNLKNI